MSAKTAFGLKVVAANEYMKGDRQGRGMWILGKPEPGQMRKMEALCMARPMSDANGGSVNAIGEDRSDSMFDFMSRMSKKDIMTAGLPDNGGIRASDGASFVFEGEAAIVKK